MVLTHRFYLAANCCRVSDGFLYCHGFWRVAFPLRGCPRWEKDFHVCDFSPLGGWRQMLIGLRSLLEKYSRQILWPRESRRHDIWRQISRPEKSRRHEILRRDRGKVADIKCMTSTFATGENSQTWNFTSNFATGKVADIKFNDVKFRDWGKSRRHEILRQFSRPGKSRRHKMYDVKFRNRGKFADMKFYVKFCDREKSQT